MTQKVTVPSILRSKQLSKITALTAYDYTFAKIIDQAGVDIILVGDSLGSVVQGLDTTLPVTLDEVIYHARCVSRAVTHALVVGDLPFMSYQSSPEDALRSAGRLLKEGGVAAVKLEGGVAMEQTIGRLVAVDIPVMGHIGLTPQSYHRMGGHKIQGRDNSLGRNGEPHAGSRDRIIEDALAVERAGAFALVVEGVPAELGDEITNLISIPTIGIGAGPGCDGQILVSTDMLGLSSQTPSFVKRYAELNSVVSEAVKSYIREVQSADFPKQDGKSVPATAMARGLRIV